MNTRRWIAAAILATATAVYAQQFSEAVQVTVVEVPVTVVDRDGNSVRGLTAENFEVTDEGKKVPIEYFEVLDLPAITAAAEKSGPAAEAPLPPAATRHFLLMFDLANSSPGTIRRAGEAAKRFVADNLADHDVAAIATFTTEQGARMITNFTRNRTLLVDAIETLGHPNYFKVGDPLLISGTRPVASDGRTNSPSMNDADIDEAGREAQMMQEKSRDAELRARLQIQLRNMANVARALDRLSGQKQIILLSEGFDPSLVTGREDLNSDAAKQENADILSGEVWKVDSEKRYGSTASGQDINEMAELFRRSDVVLHAIDIKGLRGGSDPSSAGAAVKKSFESLYLITRPTGGTVFKNGNDLSDNFAKLMKQQEVVYLLGFKAESGAKPGKFHSLKVRTVNVRGARVSHRAGYYEPSKMTEIERNLTVADIMMTDAPIRDIELNVTTVPLPGPSGRARVPVVIEMPGPRLLQGLTGKTATAQLFLYAFDKDSQVIDHLEDRIKLDLTQAAESIRKGGVRYYGTLHLPPGTYAIKSVVRVDESGLAGFSRNDLTVPSFDQATVVPPVLFTDAGNWAMIVGAPRGDNYAYPFAAGESKYIPKRDAEIASAGDYKIALFLARVPLENLSVKPMLISESGTAQPADVTLIGRTTPDESGLYTLLFSFKPKSMAAGHHELRFDVATNNGMQSATLPFTIR